MKRLFGLILAIAMILSAASAALADGVEFKTAYFTLQLPDDWAVETDDDQTEEGNECLGFFGQLSDIGLVGAAYLVYYENLKDISLWNADEEELQAYTDAILEDFAGDTPILLETVKAGKIPLVMFKGTDEDGDYIYADTMTNGYAIIFEFFVTDEDGETQYPMTNDYIKQIRTILATFQPAT